MGEKNSKVDDDEKNELIVINENVCTCRLKNKHKSGKMLEEVEFTSENQR